MSNPKKPSNAQPSKPTKRQFKASKPRVKSTKKRTQKSKPTKNVGFIVSAVVLVCLFVCALWVIWLDGQIRTHFEGHKWTVPAKVYARPLLLTVGQAIKPEQLQAELEWADYRAYSQLSLPGRFSRQDTTFTIYRRAWHFAHGAEPSRRVSVRLEQGKVIELSEAGRALPQLYLEPKLIGGIYPAHNEDRELVQLHDVPEVLIDALIATEDREFMNHYGVSVKGIARAMVANVRAGALVQGGSTLTQQLVKNFFLTNERRFTRKANEAVMSILLELRYSKEEILQTYINEVYLGQAGNRAIHGFGLASRFYFAKPLAELNLSEIATLVGLVKGASFYNPRRHPERAQQRRDLVLQLMEQAQVITENQRILAQGQRLQVVDAARAGQREYPAFLELVRTQLQQDYRLEDLQNAGLKIFTTLDPWAQHSLEAAATHHLQRLEKRHPVQQGKLEVAAVITSIEGAEVRALLGGRHAEFFGFNRALSAERSIGSLAKPMVYLAALESGRWHWGSMVDDKPVTVAGQGNQLWQPQNYDKRSHGPVPMVTAFAQSYNQATARLGMNVGLSQVAKIFTRLGYTEKVPPYPSIMLGAISMSPYQVAQLYQGIAAQGRVRSLQVIDVVTDAQGHVLTHYSQQGHQAFSASTMQWLTWGMSQVTEKGTAKALQSYLPLPIASKTGTSNDQRDAWFVGFDAEHLGVVWVGRDDNQAMPLVGGSAALPIWQDSFRLLGAKPLPEFSELAWLGVNANGQWVLPQCSSALYPVPKQRLPQAESCYDANHEIAPEPSEAKSKKGWFDWLF